MIKSIDTKYDGYRFRSRLEARWAVFFNSLGVKYQYEPQGFELNDGTAYLPDFFLPETEEWAEVKGVINYKECRKITMACLSGLNNIWLLSDIPSKEDFQEGIPLFHVFESPYPNRVFHTMRSFGSDVESSFKNEQAVPAINFHIIDKDGRATCENPLGCEKFKNHAFNEDYILLKRSKNFFTLPGLQKAFEKAKGSRFEHGQI